MKSTRIEPYCVASMIESSRFSVFK